MTIRIISVGNKPRPSHNELITTYERRLPRHISLNWLFVKHGVGEARTSMQDEAEKILKNIPPDNIVVLLDERGESLSTKQFTHKFITPNKNLTFIVGGAYGVSGAIRKRADFIISISSFVLPHQLVRLILVEQIYRGYTIDAGHPYHHS